MLVLERLFDRDDLAEARAARARTLAAYQDAKERGDTRGVHEAQRRLRKATCDVVLLEMRR